MTDVIENTKKAAPYYEDESISLIVEYVEESKEQEENKQEPVVLAEEAENASTDAAAHFGVHFMLRNDESAFGTTRKPHEETQQVRKAQTFAPVCPKQSVPAEDSLSGGEEPLSGSEPRGSDSAAGGATDSTDTNHANCKQFFCVTCDKSLKSSKSLQRHELTHRAIKRHQCEVCGRKFHQLYNLRTHQVVHTGEKPYKCAKCDKTFSWKISLKGHYQRFHKNCLDVPNFDKLTEPPTVSPIRSNVHKCAVCDKTFKRFRALEFHLQTHTAIVRCPICDKSLLDGELTVHLLTHYTTRGLWLRAVGSNSDDETYECHVCSKTFSNKNQWDFHLRSHNVNNLKISLPYYNRR